MQIIYKRTNTGAVQQWQQEIDGGKYRTISGQLGGKLVTSEWTQCEPKNVGKKNERSAEDQAIAEVKANYKKKLDKDYHKDINNIDNEKIFQAMLAEDITKAKEKHLDLLKPYGFSQPKLDGMRCICTREGMFTRTGKPITGAPHVYEALARFFLAWPELVLDGELYNHALKDDFNQIISHVRKAKPKPADLEASKANIQYHVYDCVIRREGNAGDTYSSRIQGLNQVVDQADSPHIIAVETKKFTTREQADIMYREYMDNGYEGQIIRADTPYENKRTYALLKVKEWFDSEFKFLRFEEGTGNWSGKAKAAWFELDDGSGREFKATPKGTMKYCQELLEREDELKGTMCTVTYGPKTPDGIPRFGRVKEFNRTDNL